MAYDNNLWIMPIIHRLYESDHNLHEQQLLAFHQVRSFKRKTNNNATLVCSHIYSVAKVLASISSYCMYSKGDLSSSAAVNVLFIPAAAAAMKALCV